MVEFRCNGPQVTQDRFLYWLVQCVELWASQGGLFNRFLLITERQHKMNDEDVLSKRTPAPPPLVELKLPASWGSSLL